MLTNSAEIIPNSVRSRAWTSVFNGITEQMTLVTSNQPLSYESVVDQDMAARTITAAELHRRGLMDTSKLLSITLTSAEIRKINDSALLQRRRRTLVHNLIALQDLVIQEYKYA